jgi:hypothetical protein
MGLCISTFSFAQNKTATTNPTTPLNETSALTEITPEEAAFSILENPVKDVLKLSLSSQLRIDAITISDAAGQRVKQIENDAPFINMGNLSPGSYIISVVTNRGVVSSRFLKQ